MYAIINKIKKSTNIKKIKLFPKIISISLILFLTKSKNGNKNIININGMSLKFFLLSINQEKTNKLS